MANTTKMLKTLRNNGLSLCLFGLFLGCQIGLSIVGHTQYNQEQHSHHRPGVDYWSYLGSSAFLETTMENWESEFLQMFAYVLLTAFLYQKGSSESKDPDETAPEDADPRLQPVTPQTPWPVRKGGWVLKVYENSLSLAFFLLFAVSFLLHAIGGAKAFSQNQLEHGEPAVTLLEYLGSAQFWFESLQNWQSEFFSIGLMVVLTIVLRQRGSPESKPVATPHAENP
jgi:hypothetical protein